MDSGKSQNPDARLANPNPAPTSSVIQSGASPGGDGGEPTPDMILLANHINVLRDHVYDYLDRNLGQMLDDAVIVSRQDRIMRSLRNQIKWLTVGLIVTWAIVLGAGGVYYFRSQQPQTTGASNQPQQTVLNR